MNNDIDDRLKQIRNENFIWIIYFGLIGLCLYSNFFEKNYLIYKDEASKKRYRELTITIFTIALLIYLYFAYDNWKDVLKLTPYDNNRKKFLTYYSFAGTILVLISGIIFLSIAILDTELETEIAFN